MTYDYFICGRWRNRDKILELTTKIRAKGKTAYCFLETTPSSEVGQISENPEEVMQRFEAIPNWWNDSRIKNIFVTDMNGIQNSDCLVMLLPAGKSSHIEAGVAYGLDKKLIMIGEQKETESNYLIFNENYPTINAFIDSIK